MICLLIFRFISFIEGDSHVNEEELSAHDDDPFSLIRTDDDENLMINSL